MLLAGLKRRQVFRAAAVYAVAAWAVIEVTACTAGAGWVSWQLWLNPDVPVDGLARLLGVGSIVEGSVEGSEDRIGSTVQLIDGESGMYLFSERMKGGYRERSPAGR